MICIHNACDIELFPFLFFYPASLFRALRACVACNFPQAGELTEKFKSTTEALNQGAETELGMDADTVAALRKEVSGINER